MTRQMQTSAGVLPAGPKPLLRGWFHAGAAVAAVLFTGLLVWASGHDTPRLISMLIFGLSMVELYTLSAIYHIGAWRPPVRRVLRSIDHANIFVLIAGTYTPICFNVLTGGFGIPIERLGEFRKLFDRLLGEDGPARTPDIGVQRAVYVTDSDADARAAAEQARWNMRVTLSLRNHYERVERGRAVPVPGPSEPDVDDLLDRYLVIGTPDTCVRQIRRLRDLVGITHFNGNFWFGDLEHPRVLRNSANCPLYLLCFAVGNEKGAPIALRIANHLLTKGVT